MLWKNIFDWLLAIISLFILSGPFILISLVILILDGKPVLFRQKRLGQNKRAFLIYKFRTMKEGKITRFGHLLRQTGIDELPQIFNIFQGEMSIVGPRPLTLSDIQRLKWDDTNHSLRWKIKPGITGLAQLYGGRGAKVSWLMDKTYIKQVSPSMDIKIIFLSFIVNLLGKRRVRQFLFDKKRRK